jgi:diguanylate cyclase (GGDEF)-like protein
MLLRETGKRLAGSVRPYDGVGRYGGEEFLIILPGCEPQNLVTRLEGLREAIARHPVETTDCPVPMTASFGATVYAIGATTSHDELIRCADQALYEAKAGGRNRVVYLASAGVTTLSTGS